MKAIISTILMLLCSLSGINAQTEGLPDSRHFHLKKLTDGVYAAIHNDDGGYAICNAGIIDLGDQTLVFDPFLTPEAARDLKKVAEGLFGRKVSLVVNSHRHNDHTRGNQVFYPEANIIASAFTREEIIKREPTQIAEEKEKTPKELQHVKDQLKTASASERKELMMWHGYYEGKLNSFYELKLTPPNITFDSLMTLNGSARNVQLIHMGASHTGGDVVMLLPEEKVIFMGDLLFVERHPIGHHPELWQQTLREIHQWNIETVVPGHGPISDPSAIITQLNYFRDINELAIEALSKGKSHEAFQKTPIPEKYRSWWFGKFYHSNLWHFYHLNQESAIADNK